MGAHNIHMYLAGHLTQRELNKILREQAEEDSYNSEDEDDDGDAYTGDWRTIPEIRLHANFDGTENQAFDYCLDHAEKWDFAVAVHTKDSSGNPVTIVGGWAAS